MMSYNDQSNAGISRVSKIVILVLIALFFVGAPFVLIIGRCALTGDCL